MTEKKASRQEASRHRAGSGRGQSDQYVPGLDRVAEGLRDGQGRVRDGGHDDGGGSVWAAGSLKRLAVSVASHIANGYGRGQTGDYLWFLKQARGEIYQIDTQLLFSLDFRLLSKDRYGELKAMVDESERVLAGLIRSLEH